MNNHTKKRMLSYEISTWRLGLINLNELSFVTPSFLKSFRNTSQLYRADRMEGTKKGGVAVYVRDDLASDVTVLNSGSDGTVEYLIMHFALRNIVLITIYRPPVCSNTAISYMIWEGIMNLYQIQFIPRYCVRF